MKNIIKNYIENITINDINNYLSNHDILVNDNELSFIYKYIKNNWETIFNNINDFNIDDLQNNFRYEIFIKLKELINSYKNKTTY